MASPSTSTAKTTTAASSKAKPARKAAAPAKGTASKAKPTKATPAKVTPAKTAPAKAAPTKAATTKAASKSPERPATEFSLFAPEAKEVLLTGDFCNWDGESCRMRRFKDGSWRKSLKLKPGRYEYRFVVDGHWWTDPDNPQRQQNPFGQDNSVLEIS